MCCGGMVGKGGGYGVALPPSYRVRRGRALSEVSSAFEIFDTAWDHEASHLPEPAELPQLASIGKLLGVAPRTLVASYMDAMQARKGYVATHPTVKSMRGFDERMAAVWPPLLERHYAVCDSSSCCDCYRAAAIMLTMQGQNTTVERDFSLLGLIQDSGGWVSSGNRRRAPATGVDGSMRGPRVAPQRLRRTCDLAILGHASPIHFRLPAPSCRCPDTVSEGRCQWFA